MRDPYPMSRDMEFSDEFSENFLNHVFELWFDETLEEKGLDRSDFRKGQVFLRSSFALSQFEDLETGASDVEVRVNEDAEVKAMIRLAESRSVEAGEPIFAEDIEEVTEVVLDRDQEDYGHVTVLKIPNLGWHYTFDFRRNRSYYEPLIEAADQFIELAEYAKEHDLWRGFVENAFHASERMMKIDVIFMGLPAEKHRQVQAGYHAWIQMGQGNPDLFSVFNSLKDKYRFSASYVDPRGDVDEREFELRQREADLFLAVISEHRANLPGEL